MVLAQDGEIWVLDLTVSVIYVLNLCFSKVLIRLQRGFFFVTEGTCEGI